MRRISTLLLSASAIVGISVDAFAQKPDVGCVTDQVMQEYLAADPGNKEKQALYEATLSQFIEKMKTDKNFLKRKAPTAGKYVIPVVFHVLHQDGPEKITRAQALSALEKTNKDFNGLSADFSTIHQDFDGIKATLPIELCMARLDPNGNPTDGIAYHGDNTGCGRQLNFNSLHWDNNKYLEVYILRDVECDGAINRSGYAHYPGNGGAGGERIVYNHRYIGAGGIGTSVSDDEFMSVFTHEVGHWLGLRHSFEGGCSGLNSNNSGDLVSDTPPDKGSSEQDCSDLSTREGCGYLENFENFMDYTDCYKMFTQGQVTRMIAALNSTAGKRNNLWTDANLNATGCHPDLQIVEWELTFEESAPNEGEIGTGLTVALHNIKLSKSIGEFTAGSDVIFNGVPTGLTPKVFVINDSTLKIELEGNASSHEMADDILNLSVELSDAVFNGDASGVKAKSADTRIFFKDSYGKCSDAKDPKGASINVTPSARWKFYNPYVGNSTFGLWHFPTSDARNTWGYPVIKIETYNKPLVCDLGTTNITFLAQGELIDENSSWEKPTATPGQLNLSSQVYTDWHGKTGYAGFRITYGLNQYLYGWFEIEVSVDGLSAEILRFAYSQQPNGAIEAGECAANYIQGVGSSIPELESALSVFPNPSKDVFNISYNFEEAGSYLVEVRNVVGQVIFQKQLTNFQGEYLEEINLSSQSAGMYLVSISDKSSRVVKKILKQ